MTLQSILEEDRERFLRSLEGAATLADAGKCVQDECGRLLAIYNGETDSTEVRAAAQQMLQAAGCAAQLVDSAAEPVIYEREIGATQLTGSSAGVAHLPGDAADAVQVVSGTELTQGAGHLFRSGKARRKGAVAAFVQRTAAAAAPVCGIACLGAVPLSMLLTGQSTGVLSVPGVFLLTVLGGICLFASGRLSAGSRQEVAVLREVQVRPDTERIYRNMLTLTMVIDSCLADVEEARKIPAGSAIDTAAGEKDEAKLAELFSQMLETVYAGEDPDAAADLASQIRFFLHGKGIEAVDFSEERAYAFDRIPAEENVTLRPALLKGDAVLRKGLAAVNAK